jgi:hypothetical protein
MAGHSRLAASVMAASASAVLPSAASVLAMILSDDASLAPKTAGRVAASWRRMVTASSTAARASSRRPRSDRRFDWLFSDLARSGRNASGREPASSR